MKTYKLSIELKSPIITPLYADTIWGHICWGIKYNEGEKNLKNFINMYSENPPLVLSNAFPEGMLPKPKVIAYDYKKNVNLKEYTKTKKDKKIKYISFMSFGKKYDHLSKITEAKIVERFHNTINRLTGTVLEEGGLYTVIEEWYYKGRFDIYIISLFEEQKIYELFDYAFRFGYGGDKSTGKGLINIVGIEEFEFPNKGKRLMALANFTIPNNVKVNDLYADVMVKYGKLGGDFVLYKNPFKKPILMYKEGATFKKEKDIKYIGQLLKNVHSDENIYHYSFTPLISINVLEEH